MPYRIENTAQGPRGIHTVGSGVVFIPPGESRTLDPADIERVRRQAHFKIAELDARVPPPPKEVKDALAKFDPDGDGRPGGSRKGPESTAAKGAARRRAKSPAKTATPKKRRRAKAKK